MFIIGKKIGMTRVFGETGKNVPVTLVYAPANTVTQVKTTEKDGYSAIQAAAFTKKHITKPLLGHIKKAGLENAAKLTEMRDIEGKFKMGDKLTVESFAPGDIVKVTSISKGKGFQGVIKRHGFHRGPTTHGSDHHRAPGSIGSMFPQHVVKGRKLPGHMGAKQVTTRLKIFSIEPKENILLIKGSIPGPRKAVVTVRKA